MNNPFKKEILSLLFLTFAIFIFSLIFVSEVKAACYYSWCGDGMCDDWTWDCYGFCPNGYGCDCDYECSSGNCSGGVCKSAAYCSDSDGYNFWSYGYCYDSYGYHYDFCSGNYAYDYYCSGSYCYSSYLNCNSYDGCSGAYYYDYYCSGGKCTYSYSRSCSCVSCGSCQYCSGGYCYNYCSGSDTSCGCTSCTNCNNYDGCVGVNYYNYYCSGTSCTYSISYNDSRCLKPQGSTCTSNSQCQSGYCTDGYCCNMACNGTCMHCDYSPNPGTCYYIANNTDPDNECYGTGTCGGTCNGSGSCQYPSTLVTCSSLLDCDYLNYYYQSPSTDSPTGTDVCYYRDYVDTYRYCNGAGSCAALNCSSYSNNFQYSCGTCKYIPSNYCTGDYKGSCANYSQGTSCGTGKECDGSGNCVSALKADGETCTAGSECQSGYCTDGYCCNMACSGTCTHCDRSGYEGTCYYIANNTDPDNECYGTGTCGGTCNGSGSCQYPSTLVTCSSLLDCDYLNYYYQSPSTDSPTATDYCYYRDYADTYRYCNGVGSCASLNCSSYSNVYQYGCGTCKYIPSSYCTGSTKDSCANYSQGTSCGTNMECDGSGNCVSALKADGETCTAGSECQSGYCVDGYCCEHACDGTCMHCSHTGQEGICTYIAAGEDPDNECLGAGVCNGSGGCTTCSSLNYPSTKWQRIWYDYDWNCLGDGPDETVEQFDNNWGSGNVAYGLNDYIQFQSSRSIYFGTAGIYQFTLVHDDGVKLYIDGNLEIDEWQAGSDTHKINVNLTAGYHDFRIDWFEATVSAGIEFSYETSTGCPAYCVSQGYTHAQCYGPLCRSWDQCGDQCVDGVAHDWWDSGGQNGCWWPQKCWCRNIYSNVECNRNYIASGYSYLGDGGCKILFTLFEEGGAGSNKGACGYGEPTAPDKMYAQCALNKCYSGTGYNGEKCTIFRNCNNEWQNSPTNFVEMDGNYYNWDLAAEYVGGKWDASNKQCIKCSGAKKTHKYGDTTTLSYVTCFETILPSGDISDVCESACGASPECDEKNEGECTGPDTLEKCSSTCQPITSCGDGETNCGEVCEIGDSQDCTVDGQPGTQTCQPDCSNWGPCKVGPDTTAPISEITEILSTTRTGSFMDKWLKADTYTLYISDTDPEPNPSGINPDSCYYYIEDLGTHKKKDGPRPCNSTFELKVGPGLDCETQYFGGCLIYVESVDNSGNPADNASQFKNFNIDLLPPTTQ